MQYTYPIIDLKLNNICTNPYIYIYICALYSKQSVTNVKHWHIKWNRIIDPLCMSLLWSWVLSTFWSYIHCRNTSPIRHRPIRWIHPLRYKNDSLIRHFAPSYSAFPQSQWKHDIFYFFLSDHLNLTPICSGDMARNDDRHASLIRHPHL